MECLCFISWGHSTAAVLFHIPTKGSNVSAPLVTFVIFRVLFLFLFLTVAFLTGVKWHLMGFGPRFHSGQWCWASFHVLIGHSDIFFGEISVQVLCPFLIRLLLLLLSCGDSLNILDINLLPDVGFADISPIQWVAFSLCWLWPLVLRSFPFLCSPIYVFFLCCCSFGVYPRRHCQI